MSKKETDPETGAITYEHIDDMQNYISGKISFSSGTAVGNVDAQGETAEVKLNAANCSRAGGVYDIFVVFDAITGEGFTDYSNYKIDLKAELYETDNEEGNITNSVANDYLIYTNAKINPNIIKALKNT
ncbi:MAG: hypothetical protein K5898_02235 [Ruminococcus sp.]|uniref:hypothetical protein n=1 Tax=Ruminococcus sp. TaxID=41978 RepID=UPI0025F25F34|nr:hypothetical protein [Ruminococcus sp.]MCR4793992.1 hypothetical protein [Ruminococcus sp.]